MRIPMMVAGALHLHVPVPATRSRPQSRAKGHDGEIEEFDEEEPANAKGFAALGQKEWFAQIALSDYG